MRIWTITASVTGLSLGLWSNPHGNGGHVARFDIGFDGLEHVVVCPSQCDIGQGHEDRYRGASENKFPHHYLKHKLTNDPDIPKINFGTTRR
jgi:hypothetical protein